ncbi:MAG: AraC family transcriptional regulator [Eubacteriales bacterium]|nr:AraC family transcriptional regulator [Eubacteriales bacterium]
MTGCFQPYMEQFSYHIHNVEEANKNSLRFLHMLSGQAVLRTANTEINLQPCSLLLIHAQENYRIEEASSDFYCNALNIGLRWEHSILPVFADLQNIYQHLQSLTQQNDGVLSITDELSTHQRMVSLLQIYMASHTIDKTLPIQYALYTILQNANSILKSTYKRYPYNKHVGLAMRYIHENYTRAITVEQIANYTGIHPNYLHRIFLEQSHKKILEYIMELRIHHAKKLLESTTLDIDTIAQSCSFTNTKYFFSVFKKYSGSTPNQYRKSFNLTSDESNEHLVLQSNSNIYPVKRRKHHAKL